MENVSESRDIDIDGLEEADPIPEAYYNDKTKISMANAPEKSAQTALGYKRNGPWFWRELLKSHPEMFSADNKAAISKGLSPTVDDVWIKHNQTHMGFKGSKLIHHHIDQGGVAVALPEKIHTTWSKVLHSSYKSAKISGKGILRGTLNMLGTGLLLLDILSDDPHSLGSQFEFKVSGKAKENKLYYDDDSEYYIYATKINRTYYNNGSIESITVTYDYYDGYYYDEGTKSYQGFDKKGTKTETQYYDEDGNVVNKS